MTTKPKRGRPKKDAPPVDKQVRVYSFLTPSERDWLERTYGSVYAGIQHAVRKLVAEQK